MLQTFRILALKKRLFLVFFFLFLIVISGFFVGYSRKLLAKNNTDKDGKKIYQVAVMVRDQVDNNAEEDKKNSLKIGDVLAVKEDGQQWSKTESISYLILKIRLNEEERKKIVESKLEYSKDEKVGHVISPRIYRVKMSKFNFKPDDLLTSQPFVEKIYTWDIIEEKK